MTEFVEGIQFHGALNSLSQTLLKLTAPGVPDIYQGTDLIDLSLVDPDNRRPVDFEERQRLIERLDQRSPAEYPQLCLELMESLLSGAPKLWTISRTLGFRRDNWLIFRGSYQPVHAAGDRRDNLISFVRQQDRAIAVTVAPRFSYSMTKGKLAFATGDAWGNTELLLPPTTAEIFENVLTGEVVKVTANGTILARDIFRVFPVALLAGR
jgi:(1->4)-alpha-D-glucan 1-alpha-D-glucosylmutase